MNNYDRCGCCGRVVCDDDGCPGCKRWRREQREIVENEMERS